MAIINKAEAVSVNYLRPVNAKDHIAGKAKGLVIPNTETKCNYGNQ
ncbi:hypothetical protein [Winogradskyella vidalii]|nr:hypothetical protein [Winogradskyella vidalii]